MVRYGMGMVQGNFQHKKAFSVREALHKPAASDRDIICTGTDWCGMVGGMKQLTLATVGFERYAKPTRRAAFLAEMERIVPWSALCGLIAPFYPKPGDGRPPVGVERMLRLYFLQQWFNRLCQVNRIARQRGRG